MFDNHTHTDASNIRLLDCINKVDKLIDRAYKLGLSGIAITDHECLGNHVEANKLVEKYPDFTTALGNEIYLTETRDKGQKYYHFILIAKDSEGYRYLKQLSSFAWYNIYEDRRMERVPTLKEDLTKCMAKARGHILGTSACIGSELGTAILNNDDETARAFIEYCIETFGKDDFYIECASSAQKDQITVNQALLSYAQEYRLKMSIGSDAHYLTADERFIHKAYLNSKGGEREVDAFYEYTYLKSEDETRELLRKSFDDYIIDWIFNCSEEMRKSIQPFSLFRKQKITEIEVKDYPKSAWWGVNNPDADEMSNYPILKSLFTSDNIQERYWVNQCWEGLEAKGLHWSDHLDYVAELEEEARVKRVIGEKLETCMFAYPNTLQHYIDLFWECGSTVAPGRGSACAALNHYLLGITQIDPVEWKLPFFRYLNDERTELGDVDIDLAPSKIQKIFARIREERGELGLLQIVTYGTETTKSAILTACRGYRSEDFPDGINVDDAQYLSSLVPAERGFLWSIHDVLYGNPEKGREPVTTFIQEIEQYEGLAQIIERIEGLINKRSSHASGVVLLNNETVFDYVPVMRTPSGALITQWDLHDIEWAGLVKYDFLLTSVQDIITQTLEMLQENGEIEKDLSLREAYNKYLHPSVLPQDDPKIWNALKNGEVLGCFQFDSPVGKTAASKIQPRSLHEMTDANSLMRLMASEKGQESPLDKYVRFKNNINLWYDEMRTAGLTEKEQQTLEPYFKPSYGVPPDQEALMWMLMDENICHFTLGEANSARKVVGKKLMNKIPELHQKVLEQAKSPVLGKYVWNNGVLPELGYAFSRIHALAYSFVGVQTLYLATHFNPVYWNTAYLIVQSGSIDPELGGQTDYAKMAKAIGEIRNAGIKMSLIDINKSEYSFSPDPENNQILFGLKGVKNVNEELIADIQKNRLYNSMEDFIAKTTLKKPAMIALIKGGAFDCFGDRMINMAKYLWSISDIKQNLNLQNMGSLMKYSMFPDNDDNLNLGLRVYEFNRYLKAVCKKSKEDVNYVLDERALNFLAQLNLSFDTLPLLNIKVWDKYYQKYMDVVRNFINTNKENLLNTMNKIIFKEEWDKYASGSISAWEMEVLGFYYHKHELQDIDMDKYGLSYWEDLPEEPEVDYTFKRGKSIIPIYKLNRICGTVIAKDKNKSIVYLLTTDGVVNVKFRKEYFALFDKRISQKQPDGKKKIMENSWFSRGSMIIVQGIRRGDDFIPKKYAKTPTHQLYKIINLTDNNEIEITSTRVKGDEEEEDENDNT